MEHNITKAIDFVERNEDKKALPLLIELLKNDPHNVSLLAYFAIALIGTNKIEEAEKQIEKANMLPSSENCAELLIAEGMVASEKTKNSPEVLERFNMAVSLYPDNSFALVSRGNVNQELGDDEKALNDYNRAIEIDPEYALAWASRGITKCGLGDNEGAIKDSSWAIEIDPEYALAWASRGIAKYGLGDNEGAIKDSSRAIEIDPEYGGAWVFRGLVKLKLGDNEGADKDGNRGVVVEWKNRGDVKSNLGDKKGAIFNYSEAIENDPRYVDAWNSRGVAKSNLGDDEGAIEDFSKAIELDPTYMVAWENRSISYNRIGQFDNMYADIAMAYQLGTEIPVWKPSSCDQAGVEYGKVANRYLKKFTIPKIKQLGGIFIHYFICQLTWGQNTTQSMYEGTSTYTHTGKFGLGFISFSTSGIQIVSIGDISRKNLKGRGIGGRLLLMILRNVDLSSVEKQDRQWDIPMGNIQGILTTDNGIKLVISSETWVIDGYFTGENKQIEYLLSMARTGALAHIMDHVVPEKQEENTIEEDIIAKIEKLAELKEKGILTESEFVEKKKDLLAKI